MPAFWIKLKNIMSENNNKNFFMKNRKATFGTIIAGIIIYIISGFANGIIEGLSFEKFSDLLKGDTSAKYVAVVMSGSDPNFKIPKEFKEGFGDDRKIKLTNKTQDINVEKEEDLNSKEQAKIKAEALVNDENCVAIIGNSNSELTEITLNTILQRGKGQTRPIFILPIATADNLIEKAKAEEFEGILRMVPDNKNQSLVIKRFVNKLKEKANVIILVDEENPTYSINLSKNLVNDIIEADGNIVLHQNYGNSHRLINNYTFLLNKGIKPDLIIYVGITGNGILLMEELKTFNITTPVIYTDGCTVGKFLNKAKGLKGKSYFLSAVTSSNASIEPTYKPIGKDARKLISTILNSVEGSITRKSVYEYTANNKGKIRLDNGVAGKYSFREDGNNRSMNFVIYTYENGTLTEVKGLR